MADGSRVFAVDHYLRRIGFTESVSSPTLDLLAELQLAHMIHVPFENLHAFHRRGVRIDVETSFRKVVDDHRGGWCFELNGCFGALLAEVGFRVDRVACQVWESATAEWGPPNDHLGLVVHLDGERWFVDVGFGDNCIHPLRITSGLTEAIPRATRIDLERDLFRLTEEVVDDDGNKVWEPQLQVAFEPQPMEAFERRSTYLQTQPGLSWTEKAFATRALDATGSRATLRMDVLRRRDGVGEWRDEPVAAHEWSGLLLEHFALHDSNVH